MPEHICPNCGNLERKGSQFCLKCFAELIGFPKYFTAAAEVAVAREAMESAERCREVGNADAQ